MSTRSELLLSSLVGLLIQAQLLADQYKAESGIDLGQVFDPERFKPLATDPPEEQPIYDAAGVSQPIGPYGLVMLKTVEDKRREIEAVSPKHAANMPRLFACLPGLAKLDPGSDNWWIVQTEISWAAFAGFGNPAEALAVNEYKRVAGDPAVQLPHERLIQLYQQHVPGAMALPRELTTARACAGRVLEYTRIGMDNDKVYSENIDFSPARPRGKG